MALDPFVDRGHDGRRRGVCVESVSLEESDMAIHHLDWEDDPDESTPSDPPRPQEPPSIDHAPVPPLTTPDETEGG
jgi:hypothetical protein